MFLHTNRHHRNSPRKLRSLLFECLEERRVLSVSIVDVRAVAIDQDLVTTPIFAGLLPRNDADDLAYKNTVRTFTPDFATSANDTPVISDFNGVLDGTGVWTFQGSVSNRDKPVEGMVVTLGGILANYGVTATVQANGTFSVNEAFPGLQTGIATAQTVDSTGNPSNLASCNIVVVPIVSLGGGGSVNEGNSTLLTVSRSGSTSNSLTAYFMLGGSAGYSGTSNPDYYVSPSSSGVTIPAGSSMATISINALEDGVTNEPASESVVVSLMPQSGVYQVGSSSTATVTINDMPVVTISGGSSVNEGSSAVLTVSRSGATSQSMTVNFMLGGSAGYSGTSNPDYYVSPSSSSVTIPAGSSMATISINALEDGATNEPASESVVVSLMPQGGVYQVGSSSAATVTINDIPLVTISGGGSINEGSSAVLTVSRSGSTSQSMTVNFMLGGSAGYSGTSNPDYYISPSSSSVTIPAGSSMATISINALEDGVTNEPASESVVVSLMPQSGAYQVGSSSAATVTINDMPLVTISGGGSIHEGSSAALSIFRSGSTSQSMTVNFMLGGSAGYSGTSNPDYYVSPSSSSVTIPAGSSMATITINALQDGVTEPASEFVVVSLMSQSHVYQVGSSSAATVIISDT